MLRNGQAYKSHPGMGLHTDRAQTLRAKGLMPLQRCTGQVSWRSWWSRRQMQSRVGDAAIMKDLSAWVRTVLITVHEHASRKDRMRFPVHPQAGCLWWRILQDRAVWSHKNASLHLRGCAAAVNTNTLPPVSRLRPRQLPAFCPWDGCKQ